MPSGGGQHIQLPLVASFFKNSPEFVSNKRTTKTWCFFRLYNKRALLASGCAMVTGRYRKVCWLKDSAANSEDLRIPMTLKRKNGRTNSLMNLFVFLTAFAEARVTQTHSRRFHCTRALYVPDVPMFYSQWSNHPRAISAAQSIHTRGFLSGRTRDSVFDKLDNRHKRAEKRLIT